MKRFCKDCGVELIIDENWYACFARNGTYRCKACCISRQAARNALRPEEYKAYQKQYRQDHEEEMRASAKQYYTEHREEALNYHREHYRNNREAYLANAYQCQQAENHEAYREYQREYYSEHRDEPWYREYHLNAGHLRRARLLENGPIDDIDRRAVWGRDEGHCRIKLVCDGAFVPFEEMHMDHIIPLSRGGTHTWSNVQTGCGPCNLAKGSKVLEVAL